jgi:hypothetical protein
MVLLLSRDLVEQKAVEEAPDSFFALLLDERQAMDLDLQDQKIIFVRVKQYG